MDRPYKISILIDESEKHLIKENSDSILKHRR